MVKKSKKHTKSVKNDIIFFTISGLVIAAIFIFLFTVVLPTTLNNIRKDRIISIYKSLNLDNQKYLIQSESVFGDKRIYEWDSGRSYSSQVDYVRSADVKTTVAELKSAIAKTDFTFYQEPYPGSVDFMYIYKSPKNEYLRVSVSSKTRNDEFFNKFRMGISTDNITTDPNTGPASVTIKVNLDDNNE